MFRLLAVFTLSSCLHAVLSVISSPGSVRTVVRPELSENSLVFLCSFTPIPPRPGMARYTIFDIIWRINGIEIARMTNLSNETGGRLQEKHWTSRFKLNMMVSCGVQGRFESGTTSPEQKGDEFFAGIKVVSPLSVQLSEGGQSEIKYQATVPISCGRFRRRCGIRVSTKTTSDHATSKCSTSALTRTNCVFSIWSDQWNAVHTITIHGSSDGAYGDRLVIVSAITFPILYRPNILHGVQDVQVTIVDSDLITKDRYCTAQNGRHIHTFDRRRFNVPLPGEFVLYRHKDVCLEVHGYSQPCGSTVCSCGVAVRSGPELFIWENCSNSTEKVPKRIRKYGCSNDHMKVRRVGNEYKIFLPTGAKVVLEASSCSYVTIYPSATDLNRTVGLCGNFNGDITDEFVHPNGTEDVGCHGEYCNAREYGGAWRLNDDGAPNVAGKTFYGSILSNIEKKGTPAWCAGNSINKDFRTGPVCKNMSPLVCDPSDTGIVINAICISQPGLAYTFRTEISQRFPAFPGIPLQPPVWRNGWNPGKARRFCADFFKNSIAFTACSRLVNGNLRQALFVCWVDIKITGGTEGALANLEAFKSGCVNEVLKDPKLATSIDGQPSVLDQVLDSVCPNECSRKGTCEKGLCLCRAGWIGIDCSHSNDTAPEIVGIVNGELCDTARRSPCYDVIITGNNFVQSDKLKCSFQDVEVLPNTENRGNMCIFPALFKHSSEVVCRLPKGTNCRAAGGVSVSCGVYGHYVSVTNNNRLFGNQLPFVPYNSGCRTCRLNMGIIGKSVSCEIKEGYTNNCRRVNQMLYEPRYALKWLAWADTDDPSGNGDLELADALRQRNLWCSSCLPYAIQIRLKNSNVTAVATDEQCIRLYPCDGFTDEFITFGAHYGFSCFHKGQPGGRVCPDYEVRVLCTTGLPDSDNFTSITDGSIDDVILP